MVDLLGKDQSFIDFQGLQPGLIKLRQRPGDSPLQRCPRAPSVGQATRRPRVAFSQEVWLWLGLMAHQPVQHSLSKSDEGIFDPGRGREEQEEWPGYSLLSRKTWRVCTSDPGWQIFLLLFASNASNSRGPLKYWVLTVASVRMTPDMTWSVCSGWMGPHELAPLPSLGTQK